MPVQKPRQIAVDILRREAEKVRFLDKITDQELTAAGLSPADRGLVLELCYGVVRWQETLDWLIARKATAGVRQATVRILLRLGLYQIFWLDRIPDHAAVHETVQLARQNGFAAQTGFVNALLREYLREKEQTTQLLEALKISDPALGYSHPRWLCDRWRQRWDEETLRQLLRWNNTPAAVYARLNTLKATPEILQAAWKEEKVEYQPRPLDWADPGAVYQLMSHPSLAVLPSFEKGYYYIQDPSTLLAVHALDPHPGESVLDCCAAPGGKTTYIAQLMRNQGYIMAQDVEIHRRMAIRENCDRLGVRNVNISRATSAINADLSQPFDKVLVDAPCTNTGVLRRRADLRWRITPQELQRLQTVQYHLLALAARQVKTGGLLVYSTCSLEPEENQDQLRRFLEEFPQYKLESERQLLPFADGVDGAYVARLRLIGH